MTAQKRLCTNLHEKPKIYKDKKGVLNQTGKRNISPQQGMKKIALIFFLLEETSNLIYQTEQSNCKPKISASVKGWLRCSRIEMVNNRFALT